MIRDTVRAFVRERVVPRAAEWNEAGAFPSEIVPELASLGLLGLTVPADLGGAGLDTLTAALVMEELGAGDGSIALTVAAHNSLCIGHLLVGASEEQRRRWIPALVAGERLGDVVPAVGAGARIGDERVARAQVAAVGTKADDGRSLLPQLAEYVDCGLIHDVVRGW